jgi:exodeoxyribonuclease-3
MLSILTLNIGAAARERAEATLRWLASRQEDVFVLTETSSGPGTTHLLDQLQQAGHAVIHTSNGGDRGAAIVSRIPIVANLEEEFTAVSIPGRVAGIRLATTPPVALVGLYVPSRDQTLEKTERKERFVGSLLSCIDGLSDDTRGSLVIGGDYNVISRSHRPAHPGFLQFEYGLLEALDDHGFIDAYEQCSPGEVAHSWIDRLGAGYRYDYFHVGRGLGARIRGCVYLHETRTQRLTDHAAVALQLDVVVPARLDTSDASEPTMPSLF